MSDTFNIKIGNDPENIYDAFPANREFKKRAESGDDNPGGWPSDLPKPSVGGYGYRYTDFDDIVWDGNIDRLDYVINGELRFYKVNDTRYTTEDLFGATINGEVRQGEHASKYSLVIDEHTMEKSVYGGDACTIFLGDLFPFAMFAPYDGATYGPEDDPRSLEFNHAGLYLCKSSVDYDGQLVTMQTTSVEFFKKASKIDIDHLPDGGFGYSESFKKVDIVWDGNTDGHTTVNIEDMYLCLVSEEVPTIKELLGGTAKVYTAGEATEMVLSEESLGDIGDLIMTAASIYIAKVDGALIDGIVLPKAGIYFFKDASVDPATYVSELHYGGNETVHKIDEKYLPESGGAIWDMIAKFDMDESGENIVCDKTHQELKDAIESGKAVLGIVSANLLGYITTMESPAIKSGQGGTYIDFTKSTFNMNNSGRIDFAQIDFIVNEDNTVEFDTKQAEIHYEP